MNTWKELDELGNEYHSLVLQGYGTRSANRCERQVEIANEIIESVMPFLHSIANHMFGSGVDIKNSAHENIRLRVKGASLSKTELINVGAEAIIRELKNYNPEFAMSTFLYLIVPKELSYVSLQNSIINIPRYLRRKVYKIVSESIDDKEAISRIAESDFLPTKKKIKDIVPNHMMAAALYLSVTNSWMPFCKEDSGDSQASDNYNKQPRKLDENYIVGKEACSKEDQEYSAQLQNIIQKELASLRENEQRVVRERFGFGCKEHTLEEIGELWSRGHTLTKERVRQIEAKALRRLRHPAHTRSLRELI